MADNRNYQTVVTFSFVKNYHLEGKIFLTYTYR